MTTTNQTNTTFMKNETAEAQSTGHNKWNVINLHEMDPASLLPLDENEQINITLSVDCNGFEEANNDTTDARRSEQPAQSGHQTKLTQPTISTLTRPAFDKDKVLPVFREKLGEIFKFGTNLNEAANEYQGKVQEKAINALAAILGVRRAYFDETTPEVSSILFDKLYEQCKNKGLKGRTKQTTEFHLLSKLFRQSDRRQASADAKVLIRAHNEKQTEKTFPDWVRNLGGLNKIRTEIDNFESAQHQQKEQQQRAKNKHKGNLKTLFDTARAAS